MNQAYFFLKGNLFYQVLIKCYFLAEGKNNVVLIENRHIDNFYLQLQISILN